MARIDKYDPVGGGFRAPLAAAYTGSAVPIAVGLNSSGQVVVGIGTTGIVGVVCLPGNHAAGEVIDVMRDGELVEYAGLTAGTVYTANTTTGVISNAAASGTQIYVGFTVEATRMVVSVAR